MIAITPINNSQQAALLASTQVLAHNKYGPCVMQTSRNTVLKIFYPKKGFSKRRWLPPALAFARNAKRLRQLNINSVNITAVYHNDMNHCYIVEYDKIIGTTLAEMLQDISPTQQLPATRQRPLSAQLLPVMVFISTLHQIGIDFRALHLGNLILTTQQQYALLDISDLNISAQPLRFWRRARNLRRLLTYPHDQALWQAVGLEHLLKSYNQAADLPYHEQVHLYRYLYSRTA